MIDIEKLVSEARADLEKRNDDSYRCMTSEIIALLKVGATPISINERRIMRIYLNKVSYEGITFTNITDAPVRKLKRYSKKR